jgi:succinoglycan biosynthesis transport protein ExoP
MALSGKLSSRRQPRPSETGPLELWDDGPGLNLRGLLDPAAILLFLKRNLVLIAAVAAVVTVLCTLALWMLFDQYAATALVLVDPRDVKVTATPEVLSNIGPDSIAVESLVQVAKSDAFLGALVDQEGLAKDAEFARGASNEAAQRAAAIERLRSRLAIGRRGATYVIDVTMKSRDPQKSARIANAAAKMIVDKQVELRTNANQRAIDFLGGRLADLRKRVHDKEEAAAALKAELKITDAGPGELLPARRVVELNQQLVLAKAHTEEMRARLEQLRKVGAADMLDLPTTPEMTVLSALRQDSARLSQRVTEKEAVLGQRHPDVIALRAQVTDSRRQIAAEEARLVASAKNDYQEARQREAALNDALAKAQTESGASDQNLVRLQQAESDAKTDRDVYDQLASRQKELIEGTGMTPTDVRIVSSADPPLRASSPGLPVLLAVSCLFGMMAGIGAAAAREAMRRSLVTPAQTERLVGVEVAGIIPRLSSSDTNGGSQDGAAAARWFAELCAAAPLKRAARSGLVLVTSPRDGEGKSTIASNIAEHWARARLDVLLVQVGGASNGRLKRRSGIVDVLTGDALLQDAIRWRGAGQASLLPLGAESPKPLEAARARLHALLRRCRRRFDVVVVDAPATATSSLARDLAPGAAILLVVEWDATEAKVVADAIAALDSRMISVVLNKVDLARYAQFEPVRAKTLRNAA